MTCYAFYLNHEHITRRRLTELLGRDKVRELTHKARAIFLANPALMPRCSTAFGTLVIECRLV